MGIEFVVLLQLTKSWFLCNAANYFPGFFTTWALPSGDNRSDKYEKR